MKSQTGSPSGTCPASSGRMEGDLRTNWQHPCFQCNCTYLVSHLRGSLRGSGLIEHSAAKWRKRENDGERGESSKFLAHYTKCKTFPESDTSAHVGCFQSVRFNRLSAVTNKCSLQFSFYRILTDHYFTALLPPAHSNGSDTPF